MTKASMLRHLKLEDATFDKIRQTVAKAESKTTGEIALAVTAESARYSVYELMVALCVGVLSFAVMLPFSGMIQDLLDKLMWGAAVWHLPAFLGISSFGITALLFWIANVPSIDRLIIPASVRRKTVYNRALRHFVESGVYATENRSGILIFVSYMEREVRILADTGISAKIDPALWNLIAVDLAEGLGTDDATGAFVRAVERCGELLAEHFPAYSDPEENPNELPDGLVILDDEDTE